MVEMVRIGAVAKPKDKVLNYTAIYLSGTGRWAYTAYDTYKGTASGPVDDADLFAVSLLNAGQTPIESYYSLQGLLQPMNHGCRTPLLMWTSLMPLMRLSGRYRICSESWMTTRHLM